jgi:hypothetical protein
MCVRVSIHTHIPKIIHMLDMYYTFDIHVFIQENTHIFARMRLLIIIGKYKVLKILSHYLANFN